MRRDVQEIFRQTPHEKQVMMFSATLSKDIRPVCKKFMQDVITTILCYYHVLASTNILCHYYNRYYLNLILSFCYPLLLVLLAAFPPFGLISQVGGPSVNLNLVGWGLVIGS